MAAQRLEKGWCQSLRKAIMASMKRGGSVKTEHLREFATLAGLGNFHVAAEVLFISQPTLSNHMRTLEDELGFSLFDRDKGNELTAPGSLFLDAAQTALAVLDGSMEDCRALVTAQEDAIDPVRLAVFIPHSEVHGALATDYGGSYVFCPFHMGQPHFYDFVRGQADIACTYQLERFPSLRAEADRLGLQHANLGRTPCSFAMKATHPLAAGPLTREGLRGAQFAILSSVEFGYWKSLISAFLGPDAGASFHPFFVDTTDNLRAFDLGDMILVSPTYMVREFFACREGYVSFDAVDGEELCMPRSVVWRQREERPLVEKIVARLRQVLDDGGVEGGDARPL